MTKKLTAEEKIKKTIEYCKYLKEIAKEDNQTLVFIIETECCEAETGTEVVKHTSEYSDRFITNDRFITTQLLYFELKEAVKEAQQNSKDFNNLVSVKVWIKTYKYATQLDEVVLNDYELNFERGVEI